VATTVEEEAPLSKPDFLFEIAFVGDFARTNINKLTGRLFRPPQLTKRLTAAFQQHSSSTEIYRKHHSNPRLARISRRSLKRSRVKLPKIHRRQIGDASSIFVMAS
jgi:hypothetical protein